MPYNGSGTYAAPASTFNPAVTNTAINATDWIALLADLTTALSTCILKDGQQTPTANIPMGGFKFTGLAAGSATGNSLRYEQLFTTGAVNLLGPISEVKTTVASATTPDIWTSIGNVVDYTGTVTATGFAAAPQAGARRTLICAAAAPFTAGANMLIDDIASGSSFTAIAGDQICVTAVTTTQFRLSKLNRPNGAYRSVQVFTANGTWTAPAGVRRIRVTVQGGGGGGGGAQNGVNTAAAGGAAGGRTVKTIESASFGTSQTVTIGAAGTAGVGATPTAGGNGGTSSFGAFCSATGGTGGGAAAAGALGSPGAGGVGSGGDQDATGAPGGAGVQNQSGGIGGSTPFGGGGVPSIGSNVGQNATGFGSGASGGSDNGAAARNGGTGTGGLIIVEEFY